MEVCFFNSPLHVGGWGSIDWQSFTDRIQFRGHGQDTHPFRQNGEAFSWNANTDTRSPVNLVQVLLEDTLWFSLGWTPSWPIVLPTQDRSKCRMVRSWTQLFPDRPRTHLISPSHWLLLYVPVCSDQSLPRPPLLWLLSQLCFAPQDGSV